MRIPPDKVVSFHAGSIATIQDSSAYDFVTCDSNTVSSFPTNPAPNPLWGIPVSGASTVTGIGTMTAPPVMPPPPPGAPPVNAGCITYDRGGQVWINTGTDYLQVAAFGPVSQPEALTPEQEAEMTELLLSIKAKLQQD